MRVKRSFKLCSLASRPNSALYNKQHHQQLTDIYTITAMDRLPRDQNPLAPLSFQQYQHQHQQLYQPYSPQQAITSAVNDNEYETANWSAPVTLRRRSSADIPIPQFMIPSSVNQLMNKRYALSPSNASR